MFSRFHHVAVICSDYARSKAFYTQVLGFEVIDENFRSERQSWKLDLALGDARIELFYFPGSPARASRPEAQGARHIAFAVADVAAAAAVLSAKGVALEEIRVDPYTGAKFVFFQDPDGLPLELYEVG